MPFKFLSTAIATSLIAMNTQAMNLACLVMDKTYSPQKSEFLIHNIGANQSEFSLLNGKLEYELATINSELSLVSSAKSKSTGWTTTIYEGANSDDTIFLITLTTSDKQETARANIQILIDGLEGGTNSLALECTLQK